MLLLRLSRVRVVFAILAILSALGVKEAKAQGTIFYTTGLGQLLRLNASGTSTAIATNLSPYGGVAMDPSGNLIVAKPTGPVNAVLPISILRINPTTGASATVSTGLGNIWGIAVAPNGIPGLNPGDIYVFGSPTPLSNRSDYSIIRIDRNTGAQTILASGGAFSLSDPQTGSPLVFDSSGNLWAMTGRGAIVEVDAVSGFQTQIATVAGYGGGIAANSNLYAIDGSNLIRIDPSSGGKTIVAVIPVSGTGNNSNPSFPGELPSIRGIAVDSSGTIFVGTSQALYLVNAASGKVTLFASGGANLPSIISMAISGSVTGGGLTSPTLTSISPNSAMAGAAVIAGQVLTVTLSGTGFTSSSQVTVSGGLTPGALIVTDINVASATSLTATFHVAAWTASGSYNVSVTTVAGTSNSMPFLVYPIPTVVVGHGSGTLVTPAIPANNFAVTPIDTTAFANGGILNITITLGSGPSAWLNLFAEGTPIPANGAFTTPAVWTSGGVAPAQTYTMTYTFTQGQVFQFGAEGYPGASPAGTSNTYSFTATVMGLSSSNATATSYLMANQGAASFASLGTSAALSVGWGMIQPVSGAYSPSGLAVFGYRQNNVLVTEAGVPASTTLTSGRTFARVSGPVNTGIAMANPNAQAATVQYYFTTASGDSGNGSTTIPAFGQIAAFLNQAPFNAPSSFTGSFTFNSSLPVSVIALQGLTNERNEFLITTLPVANLGAAPSTSPLTFPHYVDGGGWTTQIVLVNPSNNTLTGTVQFLGQSGAGAALTVGGVANSSFPYSIPPHGSQTLQTGGETAVTSGGSVTVTPTAASSAPSGVAIFAFRNNGITVSMAGVPAVAASTASALYAEASGDFTDAAVGSIQTGVAIANTTSSPATVTLSLYNQDGSSTGLSGTVTIPGNGHNAVFINQVQGLGNISLPFKGVLHVSSSSLISITGLRGRYNERSDFLITTIPSISLLGTVSTSPVFFPHLADGGGYTTQFILFSGVLGQSSTGTLQLFTQNGTTLNLMLR